MGIISSCNQWFMFQAPSCKDHTLFLFVVRPNISAAQLQVFDTRRWFVWIRYLMGKATSKGRSWVQLLSEPLLSSSAGWKIPGSRRTCVCALQSFSHTLILTYLSLFNVKVGWSNGKYSWSVWAGKFYQRRLIDRISYGEDIFFLVILAVFKWQT